MYINNSWMEVDDQVYGEGSKRGLFFVTNSSLLSMFK